MVVRLKGRQNLYFQFSRKEGLPEFTLQDVSKHDSESKRVWVTYKHGVYDITDFIPKHPGADKIMMAAGGAVEPFWNVYAVHKVYNLIPYCLYIVIVCTSLLFVHRYCLYILIVTF